jgi:hypothetical protein
MNRFGHIVGPAAAVVAVMLPGPAARAAAPRESFDRGIAAYARGDFTNAAELFREAVFRVVRANARFIPPYGSGATLYVRPLLIGRWPRCSLVQRAVFQ